MKVLSKLNVPGKTILTLDENIIDSNFKKVLIDGNEYDFDIAYDMENTIGINSNLEKCNEIEFV